MYTCAEIIISACILEHDEINYHNFTIINFKLPFKPYTVLNIDATKNDQKA